MQVLSEINSLQPFSYLGSHIKIHLYMKIFYTYLNQWSQAWMHFVLVSLE